MNAAEEANWAEKRNALRQRTFKQGRIVVKGMSTMDCVIRNMSLTGARLAVPNAATIPDQFELMIGDEGLKRECNVRSRSGTSAGIQFTKPLTPRELGGEFMSHRSMTDAPPLETEQAASPATPPPASATTPGISRVRHRKLPSALTRNLPW